MSDDTNQGAPGPRLRFRMPVVRRTGDGDHQVTPEASVKSMVSQRGEGTGISEGQANKRQTVRKAPDVVALRPKKGKLTLLARRLFNALLYHAQLQGIEQERYSVNLSSIIKDARYNSHNSKYIKDLIVEMQSVQIQWSVKDEENGRTIWISVPLIGGVTIETAAADTRIDPIVTWSYDSLSKELLVKPIQYTKILLEIGAQVRSFAAAALYEIGARYLTSPGRLTMREDVEWWVPVLSGNSERSKSFEYAVFKRDTLTPALAEIDALSPDFVLELIEHKSGRKVQQLQFRVIPRRSSDVALPEPLDLDLIERVVALGVKRVDAEDFCAAVPRDRLAAAVQYVERRIADVSKQPIASVTAYLRHAITDGYADAEVGTREQPEPSAPAIEASAMQTERRPHEAYVEPADVARERAAQTFAAMGPDERQEMLQVFETECVPTLPAAIRRQWEARGLSGKVGEAQFIRWLASTSS